MRRWLGRRRSQSTFDGCRTTEDLFAEMERKLVVLRQMKFRAVVARKHPPEVIADLQTCIDEGQALLDDWRR